jgi:hypothetical protein
VIWSDSFLGALHVRVKLGQTEPATLVWYRGQLGKLLAAAGDFPAAELRAHHLTTVDFTYHFVRALRALYSGQRMKSRASSRATRSAG